MDGNKLLSNVSSAFGAPMGRREITDNQNAKVQLFKVKFVDYDYDQGGAYWGGGTPLYAAIGDDFQVFRRAFSRENAKEIIQKQFPQLKFFR